jgi:Flp pilus assembly pilin Flp
MMTWLKAKLGRLHKEEEGQTIVEYALIIVLIALAVLLSSPSLTQAIIKVFSDTSSLLGYRPS